MDDHRGTGQSRGDETFRRATVDDDDASLVATSRSTKTAPGGPTDDRYRVPLLTTSRRVKRTHLAAIRSTGTLRRSGATRSDPATRGSIAPAFHAGPTGYRQAAERRGVHANPCADLQQLLEAPLELVHGVVELVVAGRCG